MLNDTPIYQTIKSTSKRLIKQTSIDLIHFNVIRVKTLRFYCTQFIRFLVLYFNGDLIVDLDLVKNCFRAIHDIEIRRGPPMGPQTLAQFNIIKNIYDLHFKPLLYPKIVFNACNLTQVLQYVSTEIVTSYNVTIINGFENYVARYLNSQFNFLFHILCPLYNNQSSESIENTLNYDYMKVVSAIIGKTYDYPKFSRFLSWTKLHGFYKTFDKKCFGFHDEEDYFALPEFYSSYIKDYFALLKSCIFVKTEELTKSKIKTKI